MYTPQVGERSEEILSPEERQHAIGDLLRVRKLYPKLEMNDPTIRAFGHPPNAPAECIFAQTTHSISADLKTQIGPCQFGGNPDCKQCGCIASMGLEALGRHRTRVGIQVKDFFRATGIIGNVVSRTRRKKDVSRDLLPILPTVRVPIEQSAATPVDEPRA
jgi:hypothetical protein